MPHAGRGERPRQRASDDEAFSRAEDAATRKEQRNGQPGARREGKRGEVQSSCRRGGCQADEQGSLRPVTVRRASRPEPGEKRRRELRSRYQPDSKRAHPQPKVDVQGENRNRHADNEEREEHGCGDSEHHRRCRRGTGGLAWHLGANSRGAWHRRQSIDEPRRRLGGKIGMPLCMEE